MSFGSVCESGKNKLCKICKLNLLNSSTLPVSIGGQYGYRLIKNFDIIVNLNTTNTWYIYL